VTVLEYYILWGGHPPEGGGSLSRLQLVDEDVHVVFGVDLNHLKAKDLKEVVVVVVALEV